MPKNVLSRAQSDSAYFWKLEDIYPTDEAWEADLPAAKAAMDALSEHNGSFLGSSAALVKLCRDYAAAQLSAERLFSYARMRRDEDNANPLYQNMTERATALLTRLDEACSFIQPQVVSAPDGVIEGYLENTKELDEYRRFLFGMLRNRPHTLTENEERLLAMAGELKQAPSSIYGMLTNADAKFPEITDENGEKVTVTKGRFIPLLESRDRRVRKDAYEAFYTLFKGYENTLAAAYAANCKGDVFYAKSRKHKDSRSASLFGNEITTDVYDNLIAAIHDRLPDLNRYMKIRQRLLGVEELRCYDLYVPLFSYESEMSYEQSVELIMEGLNPLGETYLKDSRKAFTQRWVDVYENEGKTSGAYSWGCYGAHPFILMNFQDNLDSAFTLAHELGHAMHSYYSDKGNTYLNAQYPIFLAEVASTTNELLVARHMIKNAKSKEEKSYLLNYLLEQFRTTVFRQCLFAEFEKGTHEALEAGEALTSESLKGRYKELNELYYGSVTLDEFIPYEWLRIPHFYRAFYVYQYSTGFCAAVKLSDDVYNNRPGAVERYLGFLSAGGSRPALEILKDAGVDMTKPEAIFQGLDFFKWAIDELEETL